MRWKSLRERMCLLKSVIDAAIQPSETKLGISARPATSVTANSPLAYIFFERDAK
jgi:hypothetical protein